MEIFEMKGDAAPAIFRGSETPRSFNHQDDIRNILTRWAPTSYTWSITPINGFIYLKKSGVISPHLQKVFGPAHKQVCANQQTNPTPQLHATLLLDGQLRLKI